MMEKSARLRSNEKEKCGDPVNIMPIGHSQLRPGKNQFSSTVSGQRLRSESAAIGLYNRIVAHLGQ